MPLPNSLSDTVRYLQRILQAIVDGRIEAKTLKDMTPEQLDEYHNRLVAEEKAEHDRGDALQSAEAPINPNPPADEIPAEPEV